jgi:2-dehydro-3-deoxyphosphogluconate aldolase/(4S)-4-hydroxy-2-oxoglutarate aldolase
MPQDPILEKIARLGVVPVIAMDSVDTALPLADALLAGGLPIIEITFRTRAAADVIRKLNQERPQLLVGAGTVLTRETLETAKACGARFALAPGLNPEVVRQANRIGLPFVPGVATPTEIEQALVLGCATLKFFPSEQLGGVKMLEAMFGPYAHTGLRFVPTGGVNAANLESYLKCQAVAAVGGSWLAKKEDLAGGHWDSIRDRCLAAVELVRRARPLDPLRS